MKIFEIVNYETNNRMKELDINDVIKLLKEKCQNSLKSWRNNQLFRGNKIFDKKFYLGDVSNAEPRKSANTYNYYTLWMDNSPKWKDFPKRSKSFICSSDNYTASGFGDTAIAIPFDDAKIGVCPSRDLWTSFDELSNLSDFMNFCHFLFELLEYKDPTTYEELKTLASKITKTQIIDAIIKKLLQIQDGLKRNEPIDDLYFINRMITTRFNNAWLKTATKEDIIDRIGLQINIKNGETLADVFDRILDPKEFKSYTNGNYSVSSDVEVFIEGKCIFIVVGDLSFDEISILKNEFPELKTML